MKCKDNIKIDARETSYMNEKVIKLALKRVQFHALAQAVLNIRALPPYCLLFRHMKAEGQ